MTTPSGVVARPVVRTALSRAVPRQVPPHIV